MNLLGLFVLGIFWGLVLFGDWFGFLFDVVCDLLFVCEVWFWMFFSCWW